MDINGELFQFVDPDKDLAENSHRFFEILSILNQMGKQFGRMGPRIVSGLASSWLSTD